MDMKEFVDGLKANINLMDYATKNYGFEFKDTGANLVPACCKLPTHGHVDDTASLMYYRDTNSLYCHGCKNGGGIIEFVSMMEDIESKGEGFIEIIKLICKNEDIDCSFLDNKKPLDPKIEQELERRTVLAIKYRNDLWTNKDSQGFQYLLSRGLTEQTIRNFSLGITAQNESKYGLANISNRISIPIPNSTGKKILGFSFRTLDEDDKCKYINSVTDDVFHKGSIFYGWSHAISDIRKLKHVYVVEGYFDMISMHQIGLKNTVAMMTNRMTEDQIVLLGKYVKNVTLVIDQDAAGLQGFNDTLITMLQYGLNVKVVVSLGYKGKDINDACNKLKWDAKAVEALIIKNSRDAVMFRLSNFFDEYDEKVNMMREKILKVSGILTANIQDEAKKEVIMKYAEQRLGLR